MTTEVIHLEAGQEPPTNHRCLIVTRDVTGGFFVVPDESYRRFTGPNDQPIRDEDRADAIERAKANAERFGAETIYVVI